MLEGKMSKIPPSGLRIRYRCRFWKCNYSKDKPRHRLISWNKATSCIMKRCRHLQSFTQER